MPLLIGLDGGNHLEPSNYSRLKPMLVKFHNLVRDLSRGYFASQCVLAVVWWILVFKVPGVRHATLSALPLTAILFLDLALFVLPSALAAFGHKRALIVLVPYTVAMTTFMVSYTCITGEAGWGSFLMMLATGFTISCGAILYFPRLPTHLLLRGPFAFHTAARTSTSSYILKTSGQTLFFWLVFLVVVPWAVASFEARAGLALPRTLAATSLGMLLLFLGTALGLWSAFCMSVRGRGTPLPSQMPSRLVVSGPYAWLRNPMAVAGIAQGIAVGLILGSWLVVLYALSGAVFWHYLVRPDEEADLRRRFGEEYVYYQKKVRCWIPKSISRFQNE